MDPWILLLDEIQNISGWNTNSIFIQELWEFHLALQTSSPATWNSDLIPEQIGSSKEVAFPEIFFPQNAANTFKKKKHFLWKHFIQSKYLCLFQEGYINVPTVPCCAIKHQILIVSDPVLKRLFLQISISSLQREQLPAPHWKQMWH